MRFKAQLFRAAHEVDGAVEDYDSELGKIRGSAVDKATGKPFKARVYFAAAAAAQAAPAVSF